MADIYQAWGTTNQSFTITLTSLANSATAGRKSVAIDINGGGVKVLDILCMLICEVGSGTIANDKAAYVYVYGTVDDGTTYPDAYTDADAAITFQDATANIVKIQPIPTVSTVYKSQVFGLAQMFGGRLPERIGMAVRNYSGIAFTGTSGNNKILYQLVYETSA